MNDHHRGTALAKEAWELWQAGSLKDSADRYAVALPLLEPLHYRTLVVQGEYGSVLAALGRHADAIRERHAHVEAELRLEPSGRSNGVTVARYFLAEVLLHTGDARAALEATAPSLDCNGPLLHLLHVVRAEALHSLGRAEEAEGAARAALELSVSEEQRLRIRERLRNLSVAAGQQEDAPVNGREEGTS